MKVLIVGSNPSMESKNKKVPFEGAKSMVRLQGWLEKLGLLGETEDKIEIVNVADKRTPHKVPLKKSEYQLKRLLLKAKDCDKIIALGKTASDALGMIGLEHHKIDHPSPTNRRLRDNEYVEGMLEQCKTFLKKN